MQSGEREAGGASESEAEAEREREQEQVARDRGHGPRRFFSALPGPAADAPITHIDYICISSKRRSLQPLAAGSGSLRSALKTKTPKKRNKKARI
jgi:hypothetical protein